MITFHQNVKKIKKSLKIHSYISLYLKYFNTQVEEYEILFWYIITQKEKNIWFHDSNYTTQRFNIQLCNSKLDPNLINIRNYLQKIKYMLIINSKFKLDIYFYSWYLWQIFFKMYIKVIVLHYTIIHYLIFKYLYDV